MLLNLNESCESVFKPFLVSKILAVLTLFADLILDGNPFLQEVLERKLVEQFPNTYPNMIYLCQLNRLTANCSGLLLARMAQSCNILREPTRQECERMCEIVVRIEGPGNKIEWPSDTWLLRGHRKGVEVYGKEWRGDERALELLLKKNELSRDSSD